MKNQILLFVLASLLLFGCSGVKKINTDTIVQNTNSRIITFNPNLITKSVNQKFDLLISPVDGFKMNSITDSLMDFDGILSRSLETTERVNPDGTTNALTIRQKKQMKRKKQIIDFVHDKNSTGVLTNTVSQAILSNLFNEPQNTDPIDYLLTNSTPDTYNPYSVNGQYLSVFEVTLTNKSNEVIQVDINNFYFNSGYEQLVPFKIGYFEEAHRNNQNKLNNVYRLNMSDEMVIPPKESVIKYIAIPALNPSIKKLLVKYIEGKSSTNFDFNVAVKFDQTEVISEKFTFKINDNWKIGVEYYNLIIEDSLGNIYKSRTNEVYVPRHLFNQAFTVNGIGRYRGGFILLKEKEFKFSLAKDNLIFLDYSEKVKH